MEPIVFHGELVPPAMSITRRPYPMQGPGTIEVREEGIRVHAAGRRKGYGAMGCVAMVLVFFATVALFVALDIPRSGASQGLMSTLVGIFVVLPWIGIWFGTTSLAHKAGPVGEPQTHDIPWSYVTALGASSGVAIVGISGGHASGDLFFRTPDLLPFVQTVRPRVRS